MDRASATIQISMTFHIMSLMRRKGSFTERDMLPHIAMFGLDPEMSRGFFQHLVHTMRTTLRHDNGVYTIVEEKPKTIADHMEAFRNLKGVTPRA
jgi:hypothetical protein